MIQTQDGAQGDARLDIVIAGAGFAGLSLAIALRQGLGPSASIMVADPGLRKGHEGDERASAIVAAARRLFETLGVWQSAAGQAQPILDMVVTDSRLEDAVRPVFLTFAGDVEPGEPFAHMIENRYLLDALEQKAREVDIVLRAAAVDRVTPPPERRRPNAQRSGSGPFPETNPSADRLRRSDLPFSGEGDGIRAQLSDGSRVAARLLVAADGARSSIREQAGIAVHGWDYGQSAIVTTVSHERDHEGRAVEHFLPAGPFAILPLKGRRSSIVWTEITKEAERIVALPDDAFHAELEQRFKLHLGDIGAGRIRSDFSSPVLSSPSGSR